MFLEFLTDAYRNACAQGEALTYKGHVVVLGHSNIVKENFIEGLFGGKIRYSFESPYEIKGIKTSLIKSKFNKVTLETEKWRLSRRDSSKVMTELRHAVLSHIRSLQHGRETKEEIEYNSSMVEASERKKSRFESIKNRNQGVRQIIAHKLETTKKERAAQFPKLDRKTLFFLHKNKEIQETSDNNVAYSVNLWNYDSREEFSAMNHLFLKAKAIILYVLDITLDLFSPLKQRRCESEIIENPKTPSEIMDYWLGSVHVQAQKENVKPNIVLLLTNTGAIRERERNQYITRYIQTITCLVEGKPYADYISKENIISDSFKDVRVQLFDRIKKLPSWGVKRPIRWVGLEAEILRTTCEAKSYLNVAFVGHDGYGNKPCVLISELKNLISEHGMDDHEIESFLKFHHVLGDFIYCPLPNGESCVITDPQLLVSIFGDVVSAAKRNKGIVSKEHLQCIWEIHVNQFLIDVMISYDFILPLDNQNQTYLVPCTLPVKENYLHGTELIYRAVHNPNVDDRSIPSLGTFFRLLSLCAQQSNWKLITDDYLSHNNASFEVTKDTYLILTRMKNDTIEVSAWTSREELNKVKISNDEIRALLFDIHKEIARKAEVLWIQQSKNFRVLCPHWRPGDDFLCLVEIEEKMEPRSDNVRFHPKYDKCAVHNKVLDPPLFFVTREYQKGKFKLFILCT